MLYPDYRMTSNPGDDGQCHRRPVWVFFFCEFDEAQLDPASQAAARVEGSGDSVSHCLTCLTRTAAD
jgi:hypothetical protein